MAVFNVDILTANQVLKNGSDILAGTRLYKYLLADELIDLSESYIKNNLFPDYDSIELVEKNETILIDNNEITDDTVLLLNGNGIDGGTNNIISGKKNTGIVAVTKSGNPLIGSVSPFTDKGYSCYFDGSSYLSIPASNDFAFGTGDFTVECWIKPIYYVGRYNLLLDTRNYANSSTGICINVHPDNKIEILYAGNSAYILSNITININEWNYISVVRKNSVIYIYINGILCGQGSWTYNLTDNSCIIGKAIDLSYTFKGYISDFRITKGQALYVSDFTIPTEPLPSNLLDLYRSKIVDTGTIDSYQITAKNVINTDYSFVKNIYSNSPVTSDQFGVSCAIGPDFFLVGSVGDDDKASAAGKVEMFSLDGTYIKTIYSNSPAAGDNFGMSCAIGTDFFLVGSHGDDDKGYDTGKVEMFNLDGTYIKTIYGNSPDSGDYFGYSCAIGSDFFLVGSHYDDDKGTDAGKVEIFKIIKSKNIVYTEQITSNTNLNIKFNLPLFNSIDLITTTNDLNTTTNILPSTFDYKTLFNFDTANIIDSTRKRNIQTVGDARISTTEKKFGTGSIYFDGNGDYLSIPANEDFNFGTGDFTVELWLNFISIPSDGLIFDSAENIMKFGLDYWNNKLHVGLDGTSFFSTRELNFSVNSWYHLSLVRNNGIIQLYVNGVKEGEGSYPLGITVNGLFLGKGGGSSSYYINGYIDDFKIIKGRALYTHDFDPLLNEKIFFENNNLENELKYTATSKNLIGELKVNDQILTGIQVGEYTNYPEISLDSSYNNSLKVNLANLEFEELKFDVKYYNYETVHHDVLIPDTYTFTKDQEIDQPNWVLIQPRIIPQPNTFNHIISTILSKQSFQSTSDLKVGDIVCADLLKFSAITEKNGTNYTVNDLIFKTIDFIKLDPTNDGIWIDTIYGLQDALSGENNNTVYAKIGQEIILYAGENNRLKLGNMYTLGGSNVSEYTCKFSVYISEDGVDYNLAYDNPITWVSGKEHVMSGECNYIKVIINEEYESWGRIRLNLAAGGWNIQIKKPPSEIYLQESSLFVNNIVQVPIEFQTLNGASWLVYNKTGLDTRQLKFQMTKIKELECDCWYETEGLF